MSYRLSDVPTAYTTGLNSVTLGEMYGLLEKLEGFGENAWRGQGNRAGVVYFDSGNVPTIGYGFNLNDENSLLAVLEWIRNSYGDNVFQSVSKRPNVIFAGSIKRYFDWLLKRDNPGNSSLFMVPLLFRLFLFCRHILTQHCKPSFLAPESNS
jgi:hypothetical protein